MKKYFIPYDTISGKTFFLRSFLTTLLYYFFLKIIGFDWQQIEIGERYFATIRQAYGNDISLLWIYLILTLAYYHIITTLYIKRFRAFRNFEFQFNFSWVFMLLFWTPLETGQIFLRSADKFAIISDNILDVIFFLINVAFCFLSLKNSPITDSKQHEG